jgi:hypothetical protein
VVAIVLSAAFDLVQRVGNIRMDGDMRLSCIVQGNVGNGRVEGVNPARICTRH